MATPIAPAARLRATAAALTALLLGFAPIGLAAPAVAADVEGAAFDKCGREARVNCVVDGDTFWYAGEKIRIVDINTPETSQPKCAHEAELGAEATARLTALLNEGPFELQTKGRNKDQYGRLLRSVYREGESLGDVLVREGLAEEWKGRRSSWCGEGAVVLARAGTAGGSR
jgi:endonuclease YncB( thermonuclease family)